eukprot:CAMPEP_0174359880 /NCGR_PEP_ID=MMETSP0811_2-20130205/50925_1 /TAXON_ID=73025 ORGANISM="Eutreptiella gymnastica-like, Strain CCMP1594" /NCGR_SAMPLE_ID=MMETSP0811_2 /ASSEMBLY_ACC=CAM_ASM_000667 /LENGTH=173 /DNA_ID=CAMNT_0015494989 /DNA_START=58 /DNA_END=576 /DNA_ORIENTATION=+
MQLHVKVVEAVLQKREGQEFESWVHLRHGRQQFKTKVARAAQQPQFDEEISFKLHSEQQLQLWWYGKKSMLGKDLIGKAKVPVHSLQPSIPENVWIAITPAGAGEVRCVLCTKALEASPTDAVSATPKGNLSVTPPGNLSVTPPGKSLSDSSDCKGERLINAAWFRLIIRAAW